MNPMAAKRGEDRASGWTRGYTANSRRFQHLPNHRQRGPSSTVSTVSSRRTLAGYGLDDSTEELISAVEQIVRQCPHDLIAIKSLYEAAAWEWCLHLRGGTSFEHAAAEVARRTSWMRAYLDDFRFLDHKKRRRFQVEDDANKGGKKGRGRDNILRQ